MRRDPRTRYYVDHNATSPPLPEVVEALERLWHRPTANPSSLHAPGREVQKKLGEAREMVAALVGGRAADVVFTASATEANAAALYGHGAIARRAGRPRIIVSAVEHPSIVENAQRLATLGHELEIVPVDGDGVVNLQRLQQMLPGAGLLALMWANNETGTAEPVAVAARLCRELGVRFHVDAVQAAGKLGILTAPAGIDSIALSAHKLGGLTGSGALIVNGEPPEPWLVGGGQQAGRRGGTENVHGAIAFGIAAKLWLDHGDRYRAAMRDARDAFETVLIAHGVAHTVVAKNATRLPNTSSVILPGLRAEAALAALDLAGVAASHGSACATGALEPSAVLRALGLEESAARSALRLSFGPAATAAEGREVAHRVMAVAERLRASQPTL
jgi:cysteine desulfurase